MTYYLQIIEYFVTIKMHVIQHIDWVNPLNNKWSNRVSGHNRARINLSSNSLD